MVIKRGVSYPLQPGVLNGPFVLEQYGVDPDVQAYPHPFVNLVVWYTQAAGTTVAVSYNTDPANPDPVPVSMTQVGANTNHFENSNPITGNPGSLFLDVTGSATGGVWGVL
ncbi:MAG: hypothetical protein ACYCOU_14090 [Sulfobacillus sp.]